MVNVKKMTAGDGVMTLLPPAPGLCQICATDHEPHLPHNKQSLYYQMAFKIEHGREATWADALAHCSDEMKDLWVEALKKDHGIHVNLGE